MPVRRSSAFPPCGGRWPARPDWGCAARPRASLRLAPPPRPSPQTGSRESTTFAGTHGGGGSFPRSSSALKLFLPLGAALLLAGCASQHAVGVAPGAPGFLAGLWHGFIFPFAWILSLFIDGIAVYAVPNNGGWYDFGYFIGIVFLGVGSHGASRGTPGGKKRRGK